MPTVAWLSVAPVKGLGLVARDEIVLEPYGVRDNRRFYLVDANGRKFDPKPCGESVQVQPAWDEDANTLRLEFPDGSIVEGPVELGEPVETQFNSRNVSGRFVDGGFSEAISAYMQRPLRLVRTDDPGAAVDRRRGAVSLLSTASLQELGGILGVDGVDERRFRMLIGIDGAAPHEEDEWVGREVAIGEAVVRPLGNVGRCAITTQDPDTGTPDLDTLKALASYRERGTEPLPFGVYGDVVRPGRIRLGDSVTV
jgi:uncharacterized protein YcbX